MKATSRLKVGTRWLRLVLPCAAVLASTSTVVLASTTRALAAGPTPYSCPSEVDFLSQGEPDTQLFSGTYGAGSVSFSAVGSAQSETYNALGYDPANSFLYATILGGSGSGIPGTLYQIDNTGAATSLGVISGYTPATNQPADGAFDSSGNYWITGGNGSTTANEIDVTSSPPAVTDTVTLSKAWEPIDWTYEAGYMWGLSGTSVYRADLSSGTVSTFAAPSGVTSGSYGAAWTFGNGNLGFSNNANGDIYELAVANPSGTPTFTLLATYTGPIAGSSNDGASCPGTANVDLGIVNSGPPTVAAGGAITWTQTVTNYGPGTASGFLVTDTVPAGITNVATTTAGCSVTGSTLSCAEGVLSAGTFVISLTGTAPSTNFTCITNTTSVTGNENDPNSANNTSSFQTCAPAPALTVTKSVTSTGPYDAVGQVIDYQYVAANTGNVSLSAVGISDTPTAPAGALSSGPTCMALTSPQGPCSGSTTSLAPGQSATFTATYAITQADLDNGNVADSATASGAPPGCDASVCDVTSPASTVTVPITQSPALTVNKSVTSTGPYDAVGQVIDYQYVVANTGNVSLGSVGITDTQTAPAGALSSGPTCKALSSPPGSCSGSTTSLAPGQSATFTATYAITQADLHNGSVVDSATASGAPPGCDASFCDVTSPASKVTVPLVSVPTVSTTVNDAATHLAWGGTETTGASAYDTATVTGVPGFTPTGTVTYDFFTNGTCSGEPASAQTVSLSVGAVPASPATPELAAGTYGYLASYSGDANYTSAPSSCESFRVVTGSAGLSTAVNDAATHLAWGGTETTGASAYDTATVTGVPGFTPTGTVTYDFFTNGTCSGEPASAQTVSLSVGAVPASPATPELAAGTYGYLASYSGDANYTSAPSSCESFRVVTGSAGLSTAVNDAATHLAWGGTETTGASAYDTATVTGVPGFTPTGTVTYDFFTNGTCSGEPASAQTVSLSVGAVPASPATPELAAGTYGYLASYSGDANYTSAPSSCESFRVVTGSAGLSTAVNDAATHLAWGGTETTGASAYDTATVTGVPGFTPTGTVTYDFFTNGTCSGEPASAQTVSLSVGAVPASPATPELAAGTYGYLASYSGDANYTSAPSSCESFRVVTGSAGLSTAVNDAATNLAWGGTEGAGATAFDTAILHHQGSIAPTGGVTYSFFGGRTCIGTPVSTQTVLVGVGGDVPNSTSTPSLAVGAYGFQATYSGDSNFTGATGSCEPFSVSPVNVLHVSPNSGPHSGGTKITITGTGFAPGAVVRLGQGHGAGSGSLVATKVTFVSSGKITAVTPKGAKPGTWNVFVIEPVGVQSPPHPADRFTYT